MMTRTRRSRRWLRPKARRGIALFVAMFFVAGIGALALSAIYLTANASLLSKSFEKEDELKYTSEAALAIGKASLNYNPAALPNTSYVAMLTGKTLTSGDGQPVNGVTVNLYVGPTGSTSGQFGRFASLVAEARDNSGTGFVRRLELTQESFAKYAYWSNSEQSGGGTIYFGGGDQLWGPVWSNDTLHITNTGASFHDDVGTAKNISGVAWGTFSKGYSINQKPILLPSLASLATLGPLATVGGMSFNAPTNGNETTVLMRIEFIASDLDNSGDSTGTAEGLYRIYKANAGQTPWLRADWLGTAGALPAIGTVINCGDFHFGKFFPAAIHSQPWFDTAYARLAGAINPVNVAAGHTEGALNLTAIMGHAGARCYLGGDPHLVAIERDAAHGYTNAQIHIGGEDSTFTPTDSRGAWQLYTATPNGAIAAKRPWDAGYMRPLYRGYNPNTKGVMYVNGTVGISGTVRGVITLYTPNTVVFLDDLRYANDPAKGVCVDILGIIAGANAVVADNSLTDPEYIKVGVAPTVKSLDDTPDLTLHAVIMALGTSFTVQNYNLGVTNVIGCGGVPNGRGCLYLTGGLIQNNRGAVGTSGGTGFTKRYSYDRCAVINPPPYFPTTGRFQDNRYYELDPVRFNVDNLYKSLTPK